MKNPALAALALLLLAVTPTVEAQDGTAYYGISFGEFDYSESEAPFGTGFFEDSVTSWRLMIGYQFMEHLSVEGSYGQTDTIRDSVLFGPIPAFQDEIGFETSLDQVLTIRLLGVLPFEDAGISLMGGLGYADIEQEIELSVNGSLVGSLEVSGSNPAYYLGVQYDWDRVAVRLGYEKFDFDGDVDAEEVSLTFFYKI
ncbi:MAG TPA: outer membrane beta-barrel protein [Gammaproteobacteria bacterium]|nr:outer membrane beta-barrel protein [Gammaproteobacteria bacterium]